MADASQSSPGGRVFPQVPERVFGLQLSSLASNHQAYFTAADNQIINIYLLTNSAFKDFASQNSVTVTRLRSTNFDLGPLRTLLGYHTVGHAVTDNGIPITPLLDEKFISKLVREYKKFSSDIGAFEPSEPEHANNTEVSATRSQAVSHVLPNNTSTFSPSVAHITINNNISGTGDSKVIHEIVTKTPLGTSPTLDTATTAQVNATAAMVPNALANNANTATSTVIHEPTPVAIPVPTMVPISAEVSVPTAPTSTNITTHYTSTSISPRPETNQEHTITAPPTTPKYPTTQTFTTLTHQRPQTPPERVITARLQQARAQYKTNIAELESLKAQMAELKRAKKGKGRGKGKRITFVEGGYFNPTEFSG